MERGDILELRAGRKLRGHEQRGSRYAVVVQSEDYWPTSTLVVVPTSQSAQTREYRPLVEVRASKTTALVDQMGAADISRFGEHVGSVSAAELDEIDSAIILFLGLSARL